MKKVLVVGLGGPIGGVQNYLLGMQEILEEQLQFVFMIEFARAEVHVDRILQHHGEVVHIPSENGLAAYRKTLYAELTKLRKDIDTVYLNISNFSRERMLILRKALQLGYHVVVHSHAARLLPIKNRIHRLTHRAVDWYCRRLVARCTRLAVSQRAGQFMYGEQSFQILPPGIDVARFTFSEQNRLSVRRQFGLGDDHFVIGSVGRLSLEKNLDFAVRVVDQLCSLTKKEQIRFMIVGDGPELGKLTKQVEDLGLREIVLFTGSTNQVEKYLHAMDAMIGTSLSEGMPLGFIEAQAARLPCICAEGNYPHEIALTELVHFLPLEAGEAAWANLLCTFMRDKKMPDNRRENQIDSEVEEFDKSHIAHMLHSYLTESAT